MEVNRPEKPGVGSWTALYPQLGTGDVSYLDSVSPEFFEKEKQAIFKRAWLNIGRVEQLEKVGSYFTKELVACDTSIVVVRGNDQKIRAFHNICSHRGNKLVWDDHPKEEVSGVCRQFQCKYHAWRYGLDGTLLKIAREEEFFGIDKKNYGLSPVSCDVWEGFVFINIDTSPRQTLKEFLGEMGEGLAGNPFHQMTQAYGFRAVINANWKEFSDSFAEIYHAPFLHAHMSPEMAEGLATADGVLFKLMPPHCMVSWRQVPKELERPTPMENLTQAGLFGPWARTDLAMKELPKGVNPTRDSQWGIDSNQIFPNFAILTWDPGWYLTYHYWPLTADSHLFECRMYFMPPRNTSERLAQEMTVFTVREYSFQDANTLEATHSMLKTRVKTAFPLCDQEILLRSLHHNVGVWVDELGAERTAK
jgi:phenylpropionate dioxygenase-like ring-hydroxylating dioxygenase large terminal subunit